VGDRSYKARIVATVKLFVKVPYNLMFFLLLLVFSGCLQRREVKLNETHEAAYQMSQEGRHSEAAKYLESEIKEPKRDAKYYFYHGVYLQRDDPIYNVKRFLADFQKAYELKPDRYEVVLMLGGAYSLTDDVENSILYLEKAVELFDDTFPIGHPYGGLAASYYRVGEYEKAYEVNEKAIELSPDNAWYYNRKGLILSQLEGLEPLMEYYQKAVEMDPDEIEFPKYYGNRLIEMEYDEMAIEHFNSFLAKDENASWCYADLGYIKMVQGDWEGGKELLDKAESIISNDTLTHMYMAFYEYFHGKLSRAYDYYVKYRLSLEKYTLIYRPKSVEEFEKFFAKQVLFQRLQKENAKQEAASYSTSP